jgi:hypothetical protein
VRWVRVLLLRWGWADWYLRCRGSWAAGPCRYRTPSRKDLSRHVREMHEERDG